MPIVYGKVTFTVYRIDGVPDLVLEPGRHVATHSEYRVAVTVAGITKMTEFGPAGSIIEPLEFELVDVSNSSQVLVEVMRKGDLERNLASKGRPLTWFEDQRATMFRKNVIAMDLPKGICVHLNCKWKLSRVPNISKIAL